MTDGELNRLAAIVEQRRQWGEDVWVLDRIARLIQDEQLRRREAQPSHERRGVYERV